jgi:hypothetical protein
MTAHKKEIRPTPGDRAILLRRTDWALGSITGLVLLLLLVQKSSFSPERITGSPDQPEVQSNPNTLRPRASSRASTITVTASGNEGGTSPGKSRALKHPEDHESPWRRWQFGTHWGKESNPALAAFSDWVERYLTADEPDRAAMVAEGVKLAQQRHAALLDLIIADPREALAASAPFFVRQQLPEVITAQLEQRVSGKGDFLVLATVPQAGDTGSSAAIFRSALIGKERFTAHVFGARRNQRTKTDISLHGIALDGQLALSESAVRVLDPSESINPDAKAAELICSVSGLAAGSVATSTRGDGPLMAASGDQVHWVCRGGHIEALEQRVMAAEGLASPGVVASASMTTGSRKILLIMVDFSDVPVAASSRDLAEARINEVTGFIRSNAFNQVTFQTQDVTPVLRMPRPASYYVSNNDPYTLMADARHAAGAAGYDSGNYDFDVIAFVNIGFRWSGLGYVGGKGCWVQGSLYGGVLVHELGHNLGNWHANAWVSSSVIGPDGTHVEYGNPFDPLGNAYNSLFPRNHYSANFKFLNGWLPNAYLHTVTTSGTYRIYAHDFGGNLDATRHYGIRIPVGLSVGGETVDYWVDFRPSYGTPATANGAVLKWGNDTGTQSASRLLDTQPSTLGTMEDSPLVVGQTFTDSDCSLSITTLAKGGSGQDTFLDMRIAFSSTPRVTLGEALDRPSAVWTTGGDRPWAGQTAVARDGTDAAASGANKDNRLSWMETSMTGPGVLSFWWKVSSRAYFDYLSVLANGILVDEISGELGWQPRTIAVPAGTHTFRWQYTKYESTSYGNDRGWVDQVTFTPPNDLFANRISLSGASVVAIGSNVDATSETGEPLHAGIAGGKSVWWSWTAPASGPVTISTSGSSFYTLLAVYGGSSVASLNLVGNGIGLHSALSFPAIAGTTYQIAVDGNNGAMGAVTLSIAPTPRLRMAAVQRLADGVCRVWIANADGTPIDLTRVSRVRVLAASSAAQLPGDWTQLTGPIKVSGGRLWLDDPDARHLPMRFYCAIELPE